MNSFKTLYENIIDVCTDPAASAMATSLDKCLNALVENQEHNPSDSFQTDHFNLERLRTAVRQLAEGPQSMAFKSDSLFTIDTTGQTPVWSFPVDTLDEKGEDTTIQACFDPQPVIEVVQKASVPLMLEQLNIAIDLLKKTDDTSLQYQDAIDMIKWIAEGFQKGEIKP